MVDLNKISGKTCISKISRVETLCEKTPGIIEHLRFNNDNSRKSRTGDVDQESFRKSALSLRPKDTANRSDPVDQWAAVFKCKRDAVGCAKVFLQL